MKSSEFMRKYLDMFVESLELDEKWGTSTKVSPEEKGKYAGRSKAELLKSYNALKKIQDCTLRAVLNMAVCES